MARPAHCVALLNAGVIAQQDAADIVRLQILHHTDDPVMEFEHLARHTIRQARDTADAVINLGDGTDLVNIQIAVRLLQNFCNAMEKFALGAIHWRDMLRQQLQLVADCSVINCIAHLQAQARDLSRIDLCLQLDAVLPPVLRKCLLQHLAQAVALLCPQRLR